MICTLKSEYLLKEVSDEMDDDIKRYINDIAYKNEIIRYTNI